MGERIEQAAICDGGTVYTLPRPARHHHIFAENAKVENGIVLSSIAGGEQGFITDAGRFVDRREAYRIARAAGQIGTKHGPENVLFSEDIW